MVLAYDLTFLLHQGNLLLEEDRTETRVESTDTLVLEDLTEAADKTGSESGLGDETDTGGLKRAESDISEELSGSGGSKVDSGAVVGGSLETELVDPLLLEELVTTELESTLEEVTGGGRTETSEESASTLVGNDLTETADHTTVVGDGVKLDSGLDAAGRKKSTSATGFWIRWSRWNNNRVAHSVGTSSDRKRQIDKSTNGDMIRLTHRQG